MQSSDIVNYPNNLSFTKWVILVVICFGGCHNESNEVVPSTELNSQDLTNNMSFRSSFKNDPFLFVGVIRDVDDFHTALEWPYVVFAMNYDWAVDPVYVKHLLISLAIDQALTTTETKVLYIFLEDLEGKIDFGEFFNSQLGDREKFRQTAGDGSIVIYHRDRNPQYKLFSAYHPKDGLESHVDALALVFPENESINDRFKQAKALRPHEP